MFREHDINGEQGLLYLLNDSEVIQSFHIGMLTTNLHIGAIPLQCTYFEGREAVYYKTGHLMSVEQYLHENRVIHLSWIMKGLAETVKQLMSHQLFPENICFDSRYVFLDLQSRKVHLIYIPLKSAVYEAKSKLVALLRQWMDQYVNQSTLNQQGYNDFNPMMMKLLLAIQQETTSFSSLLDIMGELGLETGQKPTPQTNWPQEALPREMVSGRTFDSPLGEYDKGMRVGGNAIGDYDKGTGAGKKAIGEGSNSKSVKKGLKIELPTHPSVNSKGILVAAVSLVAIMGILLSPLVIETKLGLALIFAAGSVWCIQKFNLFQFSSDTKEKTIAKEKTTTKEKRNNKGSSVPDPKPREYKNNSAPVQRDVPSLMTGEYSGEYGREYSRGESLCSKGPEIPALGKAEETVWIDQNSKNGVLMLRSELGSKFVTLNKEVTTLGRNPSLCDVMIDEVGVGRVHAEIHKNEDKYYIKDIQSLNGSFVNGRKIPTNQYFELKTGDQIKIGSKEVIFT